MLPNQSFRVRLESMRVLSQSTQAFSFVREDNAVLQYSPGQFFRFVFKDDNGEFERSYSLCNFDELFGQHLELVISRVEHGRATALMFDHEPGLTADVTGPFGRLVLPEPLPQRLVLVATSVGLAPYLPMLKAVELLPVKPPHKVVLLLGVRDRSEFIYGDLLMDYASRHDFFELRLCLSREAAAASHDFAGYVTEQVKAISADAGTDHYMLCGNPRMVDDVFAVLKAEGLRVKQVVREKYVFARETKTQKPVLTAEQKKLIAEKMKKYS
jgi:NAD(P)H-flavin reductase